MPKYKKQDPYAQREAEKYENPIPSRELIMEYLEELGCPASRKQLVEAFDLGSDDNMEAFRRRLIAMVRDGQLIQNRRASYALVSKMELLPGTIYAHKDGFGFVILDQGGEDVFLSPRQMRSVMHGDRVLIRTSGTDRRGRSEGSVVEILQRNTHYIVGLYRTNQGYGSVVPDNKNFVQDIAISPEHQNAAKNGELVTAEILTYPSDRYRATGKIVEILGDRMAAGVEVEVALRSYKLPHEWPQELLREMLATKTEVKEADKLGRKDFRLLPFVTIDGADAKDFDDAVYCQPLPEGGWRLYVAIADVSYYVQPNTLLDIEAYLRGNSVYFPNRVIPMLPPALSNELCSLKPKVDRLCMVCEMQISYSGKLINYQFHQAIMHSQARLTYTEVASMLAGEEISKSHKVIFSHIKDLYALYQALREQRETRGAIEFETTETRIIFDKQGKIKQIIPVVRNDAHRIIEECMLLANVATAKFLTEHKMPFLYRAHGSPEEEKLVKLQTFLKELGLKLTGGDKPAPKDFAKLLQQIAHRPDAQLIQTVMLRSLTQAVYKPEMDEHFGLAYEAYCHFTSPIRRYPDLLVHRAIRHVLNKGKPAEFEYSVESLGAYGKYCSMTERRADEATRDAVDWLKCEFMLNKVGETFEGIVTGVTGFGLFIELVDIFVEGLVHITSLENDYYHFDAIQHRLTGKRGGLVYRLGDRLKVLVAKVDLDDRKIDFDLVSE